MKIQSNFVTGKIFSNTKEAYNLFSEKRFGERVGEKIYYSLEEAYFLFKTNKMDILLKDEILSEDDVLNRFSKINKGFLTNYFVYCDLTKKGYVVKSGLKFGAVFRIYDKGSMLTDSHSKWICFPTESKNKNT